MNMYFDPKETNRVGEARNSFAGRLLTDSQFNEAMTITGILESEIKKSGTFREKLGDYAHAFARTEKFDAMKAESTLRDLFKARTGQSMNEMREQLMEREKNLSDVDPELVKDVTREIGPMIKDGNKMTFHRAYDFQASHLAGELGITNAGAKKLMTETFRQEAGGELYDWGKGLEEKYYRPQIEAEKQEREKPARTRRTRQPRPR
ncbi:MAG: hypothetical protein ACSHXI_16435 [Hoeflea sp.]|uniref:hypothetical protein n=1 Tax=Hoeflea sp. TaxID=1940281 RepID=UPI003EF32523